MREKKKRREREIEGKDRRGRTGESRSRRKEGGERGGTESQHTRLPLVEQHRLLLNAAKYSLSRARRLPPSLLMAACLNTGWVNVCVCTVAPGCMLNTVPEILLQSNKAFSSPASRDNYCTSPREKERERETQPTNGRERKREQEAWGMREGRQRAARHNKLLIIICTLLTRSSGSAPPTDFIWHILNNFESPIHHSVYMGLTVTSLTSAVCLTYI